MSDTEELSTYCNVEKPTSDFVSFPMWDQRYFNVDLQLCNVTDIGMLADVDL